MRSCSIDECENAALTQDGLLRLSVGVRTLGEHLLTFAHLLMQLFDVCLERGDFLQDVIVRFHE